MSAGRQRFDAPHGWGVPREPFDDLRHVLRTPWDFWPIAGNPDSWHERFRLSYTGSNATAVCGLGLQLKASEPDGVSSRPCWHCVTPGAAEARWAQLWPAEPPA